MMVNCPKCGFSQPKDQFCASCGVDMDRYQPEKPPLIKRIITSWIFQLIVLVFVVGIAALYIRSQRSDKAFTVRSARPAQAQRQVPRESEDTEVSADGLQNSENLTDSDASIPPPETRAQNQETESSEQAEAIVPRQTVMRVTFGEISVEALSNLRNIARNERSGLDSIIGTIQDVKNLQPEILGQNFIRKGSFSSQSLGANQSFNRFEGLQADQTEFNEGLRFNFTPTLIRASSSEVRLEIQRGFKLNLEDNGETNFETLANFTATIPTSGAIFIAGIIPNEEYSEDVVSEYSRAPLFDILTSSEFRNGLSDFLILIEITNN